MEKNIPAEARLAAKPSLLLASVLVGACAGLIAVLYRFLLSKAEWLCALLRAQATGPWQALLFVLGMLLLGALTGRITQSEPLIKGSGIPQVEAQYLGYLQPRWFPVLWKKLVAGALCIVGGLSLGREGPSIQLGAMAAEGVSTGRAEAERRCLLVCGACAGLAGAFNAPLAGVMFALEEVHKRISPDALIPATLAAVTADIVDRLFYGAPATLGLPAVDMLPIGLYALYALCGVGLGAFAALYNKTLNATQALYGKLRAPLWIRFMIPFGVAAGVGLLLPEILGGGGGILAGLAAEKYTLGFMAALLLAKFLFSMVCFCAGTPGGIFFPMLVLGSLLGCIFGRIFARFFALPESYVVNFMLIGMAGIFAGVVRAPLTGILLVLEMSGSLTQVLGLTIVSCAAWLTATLLGSKPVYEALLENLLATQNSPAENPAGPHDET